MLANDFDVVVLCAKEHQHVHLPDVEVIQCPLDDGPPPSADEIRRACSTAKRVARRLALGQRVLVTCHMGWNRSGLVTALTLREMGLTPRQAIGVVRVARGPKALGNRHFVTLIGLVKGSASSEVRP
jgi:protein-tyrosine phosphatase